MPPFPDYSIALTRADPEPKPMETLETSALDFSDLGHTRALKKTFLSLLHLHGERGGKQ